MNLKSKLFAYVIITLMFYISVAVYISIFHYTPDFIGLLHFFTYTDLVRGNYAIIFILIPVFSLLSGVIGNVLTKNIWIFSVINFLICFCTVFYLDSHTEGQDYAMSSIEYSLIILTITLLSAVSAKFIRKSFQR